MINPNIVVKFLTQEKLGVNSLLFGRSTHIALFGRPLERRSAVSSTVVAKFCTCYFLGLVGKLA
jgi:hypothetical protein